MIDRRALRSAIEARRSEAEEKAIPEQVTCILDVFGSLEREPGKRIEEHGKLRLERESAGRLGKRETVYDDGVLVFAHEPPNEHRNYGMIELYQPGDEWEQEVAALAASAANLQLREDDLRLYDTAEQWGIDPAEVAIEEREGVPA